MFWQTNGPRARLGAAVLLALVCAGGCSKGRAKVSGKVTFANQPVTVGTVSFWGGPGLVGSAPLQPDGSYSVADAPVGDVKITVTTPTGVSLQKAMQPPPPGMKGMPPEFVPEGAGDPANPGKLKITPIPDKYKDQSKTPLTFTVVKGSQEHDITLAP